MGSLPLLHETLWDAGSSSVILSTDEDKPGMPHGHTPHQRPSTQQEKTGSPDFCLSSFHHTQTAGGWCSGRTVGSLSLSMSLRSEELPANIACKERVFKKMGACNEFGVSLSCSPSQSCPSHLPATTPQPITQQPTIHTPETDILIFFFYCLPWLLVSGRSRALPA